MHMNRWHLSPLSSTMGENASNKIKLSGKETQRQILNPWNDILSHGKNKNKTITQMKESEI